MSIKSVLASVLVVCLLTAQAPIVWGGAPATPAAEEQDPANPAAKDDEEEQKSVAPWVLGGILIGGGAAAAIALSQDDGDGDGGAPPPPADDGAPPADEGCTDDDAVGTWTAETPENHGTRWTMTLDAGGGATLGYADEIHGDPDMAMIRVDSGTWDLSDCTLTVNADADLIEGSGEISGNQVTIAGKTFSK